VHRFRWLLLIALLAASLSARSQNLPDLGDSAQSELSPQAERRIGESIMREIRRDPDYIDDPEITDYIQGLGSRLTNASPAGRQTFEFFIVRDRMINAFALPGGFIGAHSGLVLAAQSESELAGVLSHEIAHVQQRHVARQLEAQSKISGVSLAALALAILAARSNPQAAQAAIIATQAAPAAVFLNYSREFEREADRLGFQTLQSSGFDPSGMATFFERLQKATRLHENNAPVYLRTHPLTTERIADMQVRTDGTQYRQRPDSYEFQLVRAKLRAADGRPDEAVTFLRTALAEKRFADEGAVRYGYAAALARAKDIKGAEAEFSALRKIGRSHPMHETLAARIRAETGDFAAAERILAAARQKFPDVVAIKFEHAEVLQRLGRNREAVEALNDLAKQRPQWPRVYRALAQSYSDLGQRVQQHRALAESYYLQGGLASAIEQLQLAQSAGDGDFYTLSTVDVRLRELKALQAEEIKQRKRF
jgi:beta-barrel assembly-enhancing protease